MLLLRYGLRPAVGCIKIDVAAAKVRFVVGRQLLRGSQLLVEQFAAHRGFNAMIGGLFEVPTQPKSERRPTTAGYLIEAGNGLRRSNRVRLRQGKYSRRPITSLHVAGAAAVSAS